MMHSPFKPRTIGGVRYSNAHDYLHRRGYLGSMLFVGLILQIIMLPSVLGVGVVTLDSPDWNYTDGDSAWASYPEDYSAFYDQDWNTYARCQSGQSCDLLLNYTLESTCNVSDINVSIKHGGNADGNYSLPDYCYDSTEQYNVQMRFVSDVAASISDSYCLAFNNDTFQKITPTGSGSPAGYRLWEIDIYYNGCHIPISTPNIPEYVECNSSNIGRFACGGPDMQYVMECVNKTFGPYIEYDFNSSNITYCPGGCYNGQCYDFGINCYDQCNSGQKICQDDFVVSCQQDTNGCYEWSSSNKEYCEYGCYNGNCITDLDNCDYGEEECSETVRMNCTQNSHGFWRMSPLEVCEYNCIFNTSSDNTVCIEINDAHVIANSFDRAAHMTGYAFSGYLSIAWILSTIILTVIFLYLGSLYNVHGMSSVALVLMLAMTIFGMILTASPGVAIIPLHIGIIMLIFSGLIMYGGRQ